jgi:hypothetical protein
MTRITTTDSALQLGCLFGAKGDTPLVASDDRAVIERMVWLFNRMLDDNDDRYRAEVERLWVDEPEIVPMRAALEGNVYRGPDALDDFRTASMEAWSELEIEMADIQGAGPRYMCTGTLRARGRESGAEFSTQMWAVIDVENGRVSRLAAHLTRASALEEM